MTAATAYLDDVRAQFRKYKKLAEDAVAQVTDEDLLRTVDAESNSMAIIMRHMAGNLRSRFTDFLTSDGEKPSRNRDGEFELAAPLDRPAILSDWESGWNRLFVALDALESDDLLRDVYVRGERLSVIQALDRQMTHHAYHVGQIVFLAKHLRHDTWTSLSIPRRRPSA
jgi:Protein of unknown function (DUF1572)